MTIVHRFGESSISVLNKGNAACSAVQQQHLGLSSHEPPVNNWNTPRHGSSFQLKPPEGCSSPTPEPLSNQCLLDPPDSATSTSEGYAEESLDLAAQKIRANDLPNFEPMAYPIFTWGTLESSEFTGLLDTAFDEEVHWKTNCFRVPHGNAGKVFTKELACLFCAFATGSKLESIALKEVSSLQLLLLQKPFPKSKQQDHISCLERPMRLWEE